MNEHEQAIWSVLGSVMDPEIPVVSLIEMGIIRDVRVTGEAAVITITPTFSGCPALEVMQREIAKAVSTIGYTQVNVEVNLAPPWSTDHITPAGRKKLRAFGIAPPRMHHGDVHAALLKPVECPACGSIKTTMQNSFGPTPCRMIFTCQDCREPFELFKPL